MTNQEHNRRFDDAVTRNLQVEREAIERRWEWLQENQTHEEWKRLKDEAE